jgi:hypothetical protein
MPTSSNSTYQAYDLAVMPSCKWCRESTAIQAELGDVEIISSHLGWRWDDDR